MPSGASESHTSPASRSVPSTAFTRLARRLMRARSTGAGYSSTASGATCAPATSTSSSMARSALTAMASGSMPRSKRALDSLRSLSRFELRAMPMRSK